MATLSTITDRLQDLFDFPNLEDIALNGLQIQGCEEIKKISVAVDASLSILEEVKRRGSQFLLVHHGIFWNHDEPISGYRRSVIKSFLEADVSLYGLHLPLDTHSQHGNSALLAEFLGLPIVSETAYCGGVPCGIIAENPSKLSVATLCESLSQLDGAVQNFVKLRFGPTVPERICIVSGSGCQQLQHFSEDNFDTLITGEPRQFAYHFAKGEKLNALFPGHYASETLGVQSVGRYLAKEYSIDWDYISEPTGI